MKNKRKKWVVIKDENTLEAFNFFKMIYTRWQIASMNYEKCIRKNKIKPPAHVIEFLRTFQNYLGSVISLWWQILNLEKRIQLPKQLMIEFDNHLDQMKNNEEFVFVKKLRNNIFHQVFPPVKLSTTVTGCPFASQEPSLEATFQNGSSVIKLDLADNPAVGIGYEKNITLRKSDLLGLKWNRLARSYIDKMPDKIAAQTVIIHFHKLFERFFKWFFEQFFHRLFKLK